MFSSVSGYFMEFQGALVCCRRVQERFTGVSRGFQDVSKVFEIFERA